MCLLLEGNGQKHFYDVAHMVMMFALEGLFTVFAVVWYENWILEGGLKTLFVLFILLVLAKVCASYLLPNC